MRDVDGVAPVSRPCTPINRGAQKAFTECSVLIELTCVKLQGHFGDSVSGKTAAHVLGVEGTRLKLLTILHACTIGSKRNISMRSSQHSLKEEWQTAQPQWPPASIALI